MTLLAAWRTIDPAERLARLRSLRMAVRLLAGGAGAHVEDAIAAAEGDAALLPAADAALDSLPSITLRRVLATFAATLPPYNPKADGERSYDEACRAMRERAR